MNITVHCPVEDCEGDIELDINVRNGSAATFDEPEDPSEAELTNASDVPTVCPHCNITYDKAQAESLERQITSALREVERGTPLRGTAAYRSARKLERYEHDSDSI